MNDVQVQHYAEIALNLPIDGLYTYSIPTYMEIQVGHLSWFLLEESVLVVMLSTLHPGRDEDNKSIEKLLDPNLCLMLVCWIFQWASRYCCRIGRGDSDNAERLQRSIYENFCCNRERYRSLGFGSSKEQRRMVISTDIK